MALRRLGPDPSGQKIMTAKAQLLAFKVEGLSVRGANLLKQEMLARGGEVALPHRAALLEGSDTGAILLGTVAQFRHLWPKLRVQPFGLKALADAIAAALAFDGPSWVTSAGLWNRRRPGLILPGPRLKDPRTGQIWPGRNASSPPVEAEAVGSAFLWWEGPSDWSSASVIAGGYGLVLAGEGPSELEELPPGRLLRAGSAEVLGERFEPGVLLLSPEAPERWPGEVAWGLSQGTFIFSVPEEGPVEPLLRTFADLENRELS